MSRILLYFVLFFCTCINISNATIVKGTITNKEKQVVKFAVIIVEGTEIITTSNENGKYELDLEQGNYTLTVSAMNYASTSKTIEVKSDTIRVDFLLDIQAFSIDSVVITAGEDLGVRIMRKVIAKRNEHAQKMKTFESDIYLKGSLRILKMPKMIMGQKLEDSSFKEMGLDSAGRGIVYLLEQNTHYYYQAPDKEFNYIQSVRTSGDPQGLGFAQMPPIINIYENNISVLGGLNSRGFVSPAASNALYYYDFKFEGSYEENGRYINKIKVIPKRKYEPLFSGFVYVVEDEWLFKAIDLELTKASAIEILDTLRLLQTYNTYRKTDLWVIQSQTIIPYLELFGVGIGGAFISNYKNQIVNQSIAPEIFKQKFLSVYDSTALDKSKDYWDSTRVIPLTTEEQKDFVLKDSLMQEYKIKDSIEGKKIRWNINPMGLLASGIQVGNRTWNVSLNPLLEMVNYNSVEGLNITLNPKYSYQLNTNNKLSLAWHTRYGIQGKQWYNKLKLSWINENKFHSEKQNALFVEGGKYIFDITGLMPLSEIYNTYTTLKGKNLLKFYEANFIKISEAYQLGNGWKWNIDLSFEDRKPLSNTAFYTWGDKDNVKKLTPNNPAELPRFEPHQALVTQIAVSYQPGWQYVKLPKKIEAIRSNKPIFTLRYSKGIKGVLGSDVDFDKWQFDVRHSIGMKLAGKINYHFEMGGFLNSKEVGNPDFQHFIGNQKLFASEYLNAFQLAPYYALSNTDPFYARLHLEWRLSGLLSNKIPGLKQLNWHLLAGTNALYRPHQPHYIEAFVGIDNIGYKMFRFGRVDFVMGFAPYFSQPIYGIKVGMDLGKFTGVSVEF